MEAFSIHPGSCSCTDCVYRSRSKQTNVQQLLQDGTDIDKLFLGKFLPLRERKLLEKLIRTRDVYDGVRNQLLSASDQTIPKHKKRRRDEDLSSEQSSAVLQMVDLVDKGQMGPGNASKAKLSSCCSSCSCKSLTKIRKRLGRHKKHHKTHRHIVDLVDRGRMGYANVSKAKLSSCCSCCSCETLRKIRKRMEKEDKKHPKVHRQIVTCEDIAKYCEEAAEKGRKRRRKLSTKISKISSKIGAAARSKIKKNLSEPTVMSKSKALVKRIRSKRKAIDSSTEIVSRDQKTKTAKAQSRKVKKIQSRSSKDSATVLGTLAAKIKKDSLILFKEKLLKKRPYEKNKHVECKPGTCKVSTCLPEECFKKIKSTGIGDTRRRKHHHRYSDTGRDKSQFSMKIRPKKVKVRESQIQIAKTKSSSSLTTILKTREMASLSKTELKAKIPVTPKPVKGMHGKALAKSAASMTSIPKLKAKAQLATEEEKVGPKLKTKAKRRHVAKHKDLEENLPVEVIPKSETKTATTKPATKSTFSLTSVAKGKATKARSKSIKTLERHEGEPASSPTRYKTGRQKPRREPLQDMEETDIQEPIEPIKVKQKKRIKPAHGKKQRQKYKHSKTQFAGALARVSKHSHLRDSTSQSSKPHGRNVLSKSKSQGRSALASIERLKRKSVGSAGFSQKTSSRSRTKSKHKHSQSAENFTKKSRYILKEPPPEIDENYIECYPNRQAVKISSSFSFNIEFYKDKYPCVEVDEQPLDEFESPKTPRPRKKSKQTRTKSHRRKSKDQASGHARSRHNMSSQSGSTQSFKSTQVAHKLKRCFCTQKLIQTKKQKLNYVESKKTMASLDSREREVVARQIRTQTKQSGIAYVVPPSTSTQAPLLPYECEPEFCTPGECDPYECLEIIKQRNRRAGKHVSRDTNTTEAPKKNRVASTSQSESKSTSSKIQSSENRKIERKRRHTQHDADLPKMEPKLSSDRSGQRQAVRIGSNFNFNIEFSKTNINDRVTANAMIYDRPIQMERRHTRPKGIKVYKPRVRHEISETTRNVKTKQTRTEPFLQRCFCTLKLFKKNKKKVEKLSPWRNRDEYVMHMQNGAKNRYNPDRSKFLPYECEPGSCIPKEYHPHDCEKPIKLRQIKLKHKYSNKCDLGSQSTFTKTSGTTTSSESQNTRFFTRGSRQKVNKINQHYNEMNITPDRFKRVMRGGSNLSSKIEFSKEKSAHCKRKDNFVTTEDYINKHTQNKYKSNTRGPQQVEHPAHHTSIDFKPKLIEKRSSVVSVIKKCFSILKFPKKTNKLELENKNNVISESARTSHPFPRPQISEYKNTLARSSKLPYILSSLERSPNFCSPGMCTPYERHEEYKRQDIMKLDKPYDNMNRPKRKMVKSVTSDFSGSTKAKSTQSRLLKHRAKEDQKLRNKQRGMKAARSFSPSRPALCEGSNFNFSKKKSIRNSTINNRVEKFYTVSDISMINRTKDHHYFPQENNFGKEHKASNVGLFLKKCFCRMGLQKQNIPEREFHWQQPITTQFVQVERNYKKNIGLNLTKSGCNVLNKTKETLQSKLSEGRYVFKENLIESQNGMKTSRYNGSRLFPNSSFTRRGHIRSEIDVNFDKIKKILNIRKMNPFYQSFYALNVKVPKSYGDCAPGQCDPVDCKQRIRRINRKNRLKFDRTQSHIRQKLNSDPACKDISDPRKLECYERCKAEFEGKKTKPKPGPDKPLIIGSDFKIRAGVYKDTDPYKDPRRQAVRIGSDARCDFNFFRQPTRRNLCYTGPTPAGPVPRERMMMEGSRTSILRKSGNKDIAPVEEEQQQRNFQQPTRRTPFYTGPIPAGRKPRDRMMMEGSRNSFFRKSRYIEPVEEQQQRYFRQPTRRNRFYTDPTPARSIPRDRMTMEGSRSSILRKNRYKDYYIQPVEEQQRRQRKSSGIKHMMQRLSNGSAKLRKSARSDISQKMDASSAYRDPPKYRSTPRLHKKSVSTKLKYVQCKECSLPPQQPCRKSIEKNNVTFCADVNCLEYNKERPEKQRASITSRFFGRGGDQVKSTAKADQIQGQGKGEGDVDKQYGPIEGKKTVMTCLCGMKKIKNKCVCEQRFETKNEAIRPRLKDKDPKTCLCPLENLHVGLDAGPQDVCVCGYGKKRGELITKERKICRQLEQAESEMETIMPYSKKKFKKLERLESKLGPASDDKQQNECAPICRTAAKETKRKGGKGRKKKRPKFPDYDVRVTPSFECLCNKEARLRRLCPVCRAKAKGKFRKTKNKLPCTCMEEEIVPEKPKDLSKCPMCKENIKKKKLKAPKCPCCDKPFSIKDGRANATALAQLAALEKPVDNTPLFEMTLNTTNMKIVNKEEVLTKIGKSSKQAHEQKEKALKQAMRHGSKCKCCVCRGLKKGALAGAPIALKPDAVSKPCVCGSVVCKKDWDKIKQEQAALASVASKLRKCICGSPICAEESSKRPAELLEEAREEEHVKELAKLAKAKEKAYQKARKQRLRQREKARKEQEKRRKRQDKAEMKTIKKNDAPGNVSMIAESLIDLGTFGSKAFCDVAKTMFRAVLHPRDAITDIRDASSDPGAAVKNMRRSIAQTGIFSTAKRIQTRFTKMPSSRRVVKGLESYPTTNYILHMADKDPRKRMKKFQDKRTREPVEFECSLYMSSMRKRPCLRVYYMCPWFYPHCMSMLGLWKQFLDILLFILAVAVWSPCIMCMELCRGFVCCVMCQG